MKDTILDLFIYGLVLFSCTYLGVTYALWDYTNLLFDMGFLK